MKVQTGVKETPTSQPFQITISDFPYESPPRDGPAVNSSRLSFPNKNATPLTPSRSIRKKEHLLTEQNNNHTLTQGPDEEILNYDSVLITNERESDKSLSGNLKKQLEAQKCEEDNNNNSSGTPLDISKNQSLEESSAQGIKDFSVKFGTGPLNHSRFDSLSGIQDPMLNISGSDFNISKPQTPNLTFSQRNFAFPQITHAMSQPCNDDPNNKSVISVPSAVADSLRSTNPDFSKTVRLNTKTGYGPANTVLNQNMFKEVTRSVARFRDVLKRGKKTLDESDSKVLQMRNEADELKRQANLLSNELKKWSEKNADLREKITFLSLVKFGSNK